jgi:hypothetical protein
VHLRGHRKKLLREGARAEAVVTDRQGASLTTHGYSAIDLALEVHFPDGSRAGLRERVDVADIGLLHGNVGDVLPVRYDPRDQSAVVIDVPAIRAELDDTMRRRDQEAVARGRRVLEGQIDAPPENASLAGLHQQLVELTELRRAFDAGLIGSDEYQRRRGLIAPSDEPD